MSGIVLSLLLAASAPAASRGAVAFHYAGELTPAQLAWCSRFDVLVTHDPLPAAQVKALHRAGVRLALYEWSVAFYAGRGGGWARGDALLNARGLRGGVGAGDIDAFYYDPASRRHARERPRAIVRRLRAMGYDGVFLDTTTEASVHPDALAEYRRRHPDLQYDAAFARFLRNLRSDLPRRGVIITNQGYRAAEHYLPWVDYDVSESLITHPDANGAFHLRPWKEIDALMRSFFSGTRFVHLNYVPRLEAEEIVPIIAIARLYGADAFVAMPDVATVADATDAYFLDLGKPLTPIVYGAGGATAYRRFEHGLVAVNASPEPLVIDQVVVPPGSNGRPTVLLLPGHGA